MSRRRPGSERRRRTPLSSAAAPLHMCEADVAEGLEFVAVDELQRRLGDQLRPGPTPRPGSLQFEYHGELTRLLELQTVQSVYLVRHFAVPRPRALLGDQHFRSLLDMLALVRGLHRQDAFSSLHLSAAGAGSPVMLRLKEALARETGLRSDPAEGDLSLRVRRPLHGSSGWEVLARLTPRPLATRHWRVCNREGALNAAVAHAMVLLGRPRADDIVLNPACGSGTLLVERCAAMPAGRAIGCDSDPEALACARANLEAAGLSDRVELHEWDACALPLADGSIGALYVDLPFGNLVGSHRENVELYPRMLQECGRVARTGARFIAITLELRLMETALAQQELWAVEQVVRVGLGGIYPRMFVLRRR